MQFALAYSTFGDEEKKVMHEVIESDMFTMGKHVKEFEDAFASYFGKKYAVMVNSGSSANLIGVAALFHRAENALQAGDEVIVPCISWATTYYPLQQYGLKLKFVDVELSTLNYDLDKLKDAVSDKTKMIVTVSVLGNPCYFDEIKALCDSKGIILFDDNCESMGAKINGNFTGTRGLVNTFSTFFSHHISTMEGGLVVTDDYEIYCLSRSLRNHGWTRDQDADSQIYDRNEDDFYEAYRFILPGYNVRPGELQGALGKVQLSKLDTFLKIRRENAAHFKALFSEDERFITQTETGESSWFCFTMIPNPEVGMKREMVLEKLKKADIGYRIITGGCFLKHDVIKYFDYEVHSRENADFVHENGFFVGNAPHDLRKELDLLYKTLK